MAVSLIVSHDFTGDTAVGTDLGTADTGQVWSTRTGSWRRLSGTARGTNDGDITTINPGSVNHSTYVSIPALGAGQYWGAIGRYKSPTDFVMAQVDPDGSVKVVNVSAGGFATLGSAVAGTMPATGGQLGLLCETRVSSGFTGQYFEAYVNGVLVAGPFETGSQGATVGTEIGLRHGATGAQTMPFDNFRGYRLDAATSISAGANQTVTPGSTVTLTGSPAGGVWTQDSGTAVTLSAPVTSSTSTMVTFVSSNTSTTSSLDRIFRYTV